MRSTSAQVKGQALKGSNMKHTTSNLKHVKIGPGATDLLLQDNHRLKNVMKSDKAPQRKEDN